MSRTTSPPSAGQQEPSKQLSREKAYVKSPNDRIDCDEASSSDDENADRSHLDSSSKTFRKRRLTLTHKTSHDVAQESQKKSKTHCESDATEQNKSNDRYTHKEAKTKFSQQMKIEVRKSRTLSNNSSSLNALPNGDTIVMTNCETLAEQTQSDDLLPFPRKLVWVCSCHGVEPIFDEDIFEEEDTLTTAAKINQDRGGVVFPYGNCAKTALFSVYDGHGEGGELVSQLVLTEIQRKLKEHSLFHKDIDEALRQTFVVVDKSLATKLQIVPRFSGTTACVVLLRDKHLYVANVGDSRAIIARKHSRQMKQNGNHNISENKKDKSSYYASIDLSVDQNPDSPGEQDRIVRSGGFVSPPPEPGLSARVWLDEGCTQIGLAMSRSIGDYAVKSIGVIAEPVVTKYEINPELDEFMIIATDGVWEFLESIDAVRIVADHMESGKGAESGCQALIAAAAAKWHEFEGDYRDDITVLVVQLKGIFGSET